MNAQTTKAMKESLMIILALTVGILNCKSQSVFIEAESFKNKGGWVVDQQFMDVMGSPYLMAHGLGTPVQDATTTVNFPKTGKYYLHVRTRNWVAQWSDEDAPGKFRIFLDDRPIEKIFGTETKEWAWSKGGSVKILKNSYTLKLKDLTGFNGRCDAIIFTTDPEFTPSTDIEKLSTFRNKMLGLPAKPKTILDFDFVVVGGGMAGTCTAISAARLGVKVALIQNRPGTWG